MRDVKNEDKEKIVNGSCSRNFYLRCKANWAIAVK